jgi:uncharacterized protein with FMN-binding domain
MLTMRKTLIVIIAVALLGGAGVFAKDHKEDSSGTAVQGASTTASTSSGTNSSQMASNSMSNHSSSTYKDGTYSGAAEDTAYGTVQVAAVISGGKIIDIKFLQMPGPEDHSKEVTAFSKDPLKQSTLQKQSASIDFVSGATQTSEGYQQSLQSALDQAA